jgi:hypothetical protein
VGSNPTLSATSFILFCLPGLVSVVVSAFDRLAPDSWVEKATRHVPTRQRHGSEYRVNIRKKNQNWLELKPCRRGA